MIQLYVGQSCVSVASANGPKHHAEGDFERCLGECFDLVGRPRRINVLRPAVQVWLSGALAKPFLIGPLKGLKGWSEAHAVAKAEALGATGFSGPCQVELEGWPESMSVVAVAVQSARLSTIEAIARAKGLALRSIRPWWAGVLEISLRMSPKTTMVCVSEPDAMTVLSGKADGLDVVSTYDPLPDLEQQRAIVARLVLSHNAGDRSVALAEWQTDEFSATSFGIHWKQQPGTEA